MSNKFKWGIIGLGNIATRFAEDLSFIDNASVYAVASRSSQKAKGFGAKFGAEQCFGDYDSFLLMMRTSMQFILPYHTRCITSSLYDY